eukprot:g186.t1
MIKFGDEVEANYQGMGEWVSAKVMGVREDGTYDLLYSHSALGGESEVPRNRIRKFGSPAPPTTDMTVEIETDVSVARSPTVRAAAAAAGTRKSNYRGPLRVGGAADLGIVQAGADGSSGFIAMKIKDAFEAGDQVEVRYRGRAWRTAQVTNVREEGSYDVSYEDGETERGIPPTLVRAPSTLVTKKAAAASASAARRGGETPEERAKRKEAKRKRREAKARAKLNVKYDENEVVGNGDSTSGGHTIDGMTHQDAVERVHELDRVVKRLQKRLSKQERVIESLREKVVEWQNQSGKLPSKAKRAEAAAAAAAKQ